MTVPDVLIPVVNPDGSWYLPFLPMNPWVFPEDPPLQGVTPADAVVRAWGNVGDPGGAGTAYTGPVELHHIVDIPTLIPNLGIPGTDFNVSTLVLQGGLGAPSLAEVLRNLYESQGKRVLMVIVWELRNSVFGPDLLGYEAEVFVAAAQPQFARPPAQPFIFIAIGILLLAIPAFILLDQATGGHLADSFTGATDRVTHSVAASVSEVVAAPFKGSALLLLGGIGLFVAIGYFNSRSGISGVNVRQARDIAAGGAAVSGAALGGPVAAARGVTAVRSAARRR